MPKYRQTDGADCIRAIDIDAMKLFAELWAVETLVIIEGNKNGLALSKAKTETVAMVGKQKLIFIKLLSIGFRNSLTGFTS